ncbi:hypothetical protein LJC49_03095 [Ruminococcaceae bacterium OttesenSCG-928-I18]|nr:hypothetical protein [Ruminococcaceae bacterium OttesenSCG-928-I18]
MGFLRKLLGTPKTSAPAAGASSNSLIPSPGPMIPNQEWLVSVSFGDSTSKNMPKALHLAREAFKFEQYEHEGTKVYQAWFRAFPDDFLRFTRLYEMVEKWKSTACMVNGQLIDRKVIGGIKYCYGDKCRNGRNDFCFGASEYTENPFGCHRLQISTYNNPWWTFGAWQGNTFFVDKVAMRSRIDQYSTAYRACPDFDYTAILQRLYALPDRLTRSQYQQIQYGNTQRYLR